MEERRKTQRQRTYLGGLIALKRRASTMDCVVRNFSADGAKVTLNHTMTLPDKFDLLIDSKERAFFARMVWRRLNEAGMRFLNEIEDDVPVPLDWARRLHTCEEENAALRRRVNQLSEPA